MVECMGLDLHFLDKGSGRAKRWVGHPFAAVVVDDEGEGEVRGLNDGHAQVNSLVIVFWILDFVSA